MLIYITRVKSGKASFSKLVQQMLGSHDASRCFPAAQSNVVVGSLGCPGCLLKFGTPETSLFS